MQASLKKSRGACRAGRLGVTAVMAVALGVAGASSAWSYAGGQRTDQLYANGRRAGIGKSGRRTRTSPPSTRSLTVITTTAGRPGRPTAAGWRSRLRPGWHPRPTGILKEIFTMAPDGSDVQQVTDLGFYAGQPTWSPDGQWIAFTTD